MFTVSTFTPLSFLKIKKFVHHGVHDFCVIVNKLIVYASSKKKTKTFFQNKQNAHVVFGWQYSWKIDLLIENFS